MEVRWRTFNAGRLTDVPTQLILVARDMQPHRIRLIGPWSFGWIESTDQPIGEAEPQRVTMPIAWQDHLGEAAGTVRFQRAFNWVTQLENNEHVWLCLDGVGGMGTISLNGHRLGELSGSQVNARFDITEVLQPRNLLVVVLSFDPNESTDEPGGLFGPVALEIE